jgi:galactonate dehydratase
VLGPCPQESIETFGGFYATILTRPIQWQDGYIVPPSAPGIGVELNEAVADANPYTQDEVFPPMADRPVEPEIR